MLQNLAQDVTKLSKTTSAFCPSPEEEAYLRKVKGVLSHINKVASGLERTLTTQAKTVDALLLAPLHPLNPTFTKASTLDYLDLHSASIEEKNKPKEDNAFRNYFFSSKAIHSMQPKEEQSKKDVSFRAMLQKPFIDKLEEPTIKSQGKETAEGRSR